ncbi:MAG TPA: LytTR family DNA-binding domain-containing protein [Bacteroidales bacterium]|nr:LytTR family DNA-binding domain-containing protein [Bacteroidales bacterium]
MKICLETIIVDDERLARNALRSLLEEIAEIHIIGEADSVDSGLRLIKATQPDLIFLDIQLAGETGFDLLEKAGTDAGIIFVTAYDEFALRAFEVNALDYLLKPVTQPRLRVTIDKILVKSKENLKNARSLDYDDSIFLMLTNKHIFLRIDTIVYITASKDYTEVYLNDGRKGLTNKPMQEWEIRLPDKHFCRIHRSTLVNLNYIARLEEYFNNSFQVYLKGMEKPFTMSRRYAAAIRNRMW